MISNAAHSRAVSALARLVNWVALLVIVLGSGIAHAHDSSPQWDHVTEVANEADEALLDRGADLPLTGSHEEPGFHCGSPMLGATVVAAGVPIAPEETGLPTGDVPPCDLGSPPPSRPPRLS
jgi:hypothetical protein